MTAVSAAGFSSIESPSHAITTSINGNVASIGLDRGVTELTKDFLIQIAYANPHEPKVLLEEDGKGSYAAMITLFPHLEFTDSKTEVGRLFSLFLFSFLFLFVSVLFSLFFLRFHWKCFP